MLKNMAKIGPLGSLGAYCHDACRKWNFRLDLILALDFFVGIDVKVLELSSAMLGLTISQ